MEITKDIKYVGVNDHQVDLFESQYKVPSGMSYNSYIIDGGEKTLVMDTTDSHFVSEWLDNIASVIPNRPTRAGTTFIPPCRLLIPRVRRGLPITLSIPIIAINKPMAALTKPLENDLLVKLPTASKPKKERRK